MLKRFAALGPRGRGKADGPAFPATMISYYDFAAKYPHCVVDGKITCPHCGAVEEVSMDKRMDIVCGTLNDHVCRGCGAILYHSVCSFRR